ncbi:hypothetical protein [Haloarcula nitratireducens]|uniref:Uncharacterized protein n=1 Tax=Haloarcula nitratireducens TaxID=2487749 RepID=A0AAW4P6B3_9EURY|nr:hypothetical protein [Halomicroarcula nitratireducens]MBX0293401.1 hypothetical protein [Halomicroarcula nitratireducens]
MSTPNGHEVAIDRLEAALNADDETAKDYEIREALQYLHIESDSVSVSSESDAVSASSESEAEPSR